jgi:endonuclease YncB( thermonuclease family)
MSKNNYTYKNKHFIKYILIQNSLLILIIICAFFLVLGTTLFFIIIFNENYFNTSFKIDTKLASYFGTFVQGLVGTTYGIAGALLIAVTLLNQSISNQNSDQLVEIRAKTPYVFYAVLEKVSDGDTLYLTADLGFYVKSLVKIRLMGINSPPLKEKGGVEAKKFLEENLSDCQLLVETRKKGKYGRYLGYIYYHPEYTKFADIIRHGKLINEELVKEGLAVEY